MADVAVHCEFKVDGGIGPSGPGDTLRLVHALRFHRPDRIVTVGDDQMLRGLVDGMEVVAVAATAKVQETGSVCAEVLSRLVKPYMGSADRVVHAFIGTERQYPWRSVEMQVGDKKIDRLRIDSSRQDTSWMFHGRWTPPLTCRTNRKMLAVPVRCLQTMPERNTPTWFMPLVTDVTHARGWNVMWLGAAAGPPPGVTLSASDEYLAYGGKSLLQQIEEVRARASAAVGWNSGGLDVAAAAGIPVLRVGEFQKHGPSADLKWGARYNSYLATATNVGLAPAAIEAERFSRELLRESLDAFLSMMGRASA